MERQTKRISTRSVFSKFAAGIFLRLQCPRSVTAMRVLSYLSSPDSCRKSRKGIASSNPVVSPARRRYQQRSSGVTEGARFPSVLRPARVSTHASVALRVSRPISYTRHGLLTGVIGGRQDHRPSGNVSPLKSARSAALGFKRRCIIEQCSRGTERETIVSQDPRREGTKGSTRNDTRSAPGWRRCVSIENAMQ